MNPKTILGMKLRKIRMRASPGMLLYSLMIDQNVLLKEVATGFSAHYKTSKVRVSQKGNPVDTSLTREATVRFRRFWPAL